MTTPEAILEQLQRQLSAKFPIQCIDGDPLSIFCEASALLVARLQQERIATEKRWWVEFWQTTLNIQPEPARSSVAVLSVPDGNVPFACFVDQSVTLRDGAQTLHFLTACAGNNPVIMPTAILSGPQQWPLVPIDGGVTMQMPDLLPLEELRITTDLRVGVAIPGTMSLFVQAPEPLLQALADGVWSWRPARGRWVNDIAGAVIFTRFPHGLFLSVPYSAELRCGFQHALPEVNGGNISIYTTVAQAELLGNGPNLARRDTLEFDIGRQGFVARILSVLPGREQETDDEFITRCGRLFRSYGISETSTVFSLILLCQITG